MPPQAFIHGLDESERLRELSLKHSSISSQLRFKVQSRSLPRTRASPERITGMRTLKYPVSLIQSLSPRFSCKALLRTALKQPAEARCSTHEQPGHRGTRPDGCQARISRCLKSVRDEEVFGTCSGRALSTFFLRGSPARRRLH